MARTAKLASTLAFWGALCGAQLALVPLAQAEAVAKATAKAGVVAEIDEDRFQQMLEESTDEKNGVKTEEGDTLRVELAAENRVLFFTTTAHPAHPSIIAVQVMRDEGVPHITTDGWRGGDRVAFDTWFHAFVRHNQTLARKWQDGQ